VKFKGVRNPIKMARNMDRVKCGNCITRVEVSKYSKKSERGVAPKSFPSMPGKTKVDATAAGKEGTRACAPERRYVEVRPGKSFVEAVGKNTTVDIPPPSPQPPLIPLEEVPLLEVYNTQSLLGEVKCITTLKELPKLIHADGRIPYQLFYAGGLKVVIKFNVTYTAKSFLTRDHNRKRWFSWLKFGVTEDYSFERLVWVKLHGLPIYLRSNDNVAAIASNFGKVLEVDGYNWSDTNISSAMARIVTQSTTLINKEVVCTLRGKNYKIGVVESEDRVKLKLWVRLQFLILLQWAI